MAQWYAEGTLSLVNGSVEVTGQDVNFNGGGVQDGYGLIVLDGSAYRLIGVDAVTSSDTLTLQKPWDGSTGTVQYQAFPTAKVSVQYLSEAKTLLASFGHLRETADLIQEFVTDRNAETLAASLRAVEAEQNALAYANQASASATKTGQDKSAVTTMAATVRSDRDTVVERTEAAVAASDRAAKDAADGLTYRTQTQAAALAGANSASGAEASNLNSKKSADASAVSAQKSEASNVQAGERLTSIQTIQTNVQGLRDATGADRATVEGILATVTAKQTDVTTKAGQVAADRTTITADKNTTVENRQAAEEAARQAAASAGSIDTTGFARLDGSAFTGPISVTTTGRPLTLNKSTASDGYSELALSTQFTTEGTNTAISVHQISPNVGGVEVRSAANAKGTLRLQPYGGSVLVGTSAVWHAGNFTPGNYASLTAPAFTGNVQITNAAPRIIYNESDTGKTWISVADGSTYSMREDDTSSANTRFLINSGSKQLALGTTEMAWDGKKVYHSGHFDPVAFAPLAGATFTGAVSVPASLTVRPENADSEGGQIILKKAPNQTINGDMVMDTQGGNLRFYDSVTTGRMLNWNAVAGTLTMNGQTVYNTANLDISKYVRNDTGQDMTGILTIRGGGLACGIRAINATAGRDYRMLSRDDGTFSISDETAGAVRLGIGSNGTLYAGSVGANAIWHAGNFTPGSYATVTAMNGRLALDGSTGMSGTIWSAAQNSFVFRPELSAGSVPSTILRNDGSNFYLLLSGASTAASSTWNALRPLTINLSTGGLSSANGQTFSGGMTVNGTATFNSPINGRAYPRKSNDGGELNFNWSGQGGQPTWVWGGADGTNMYVYNPSNFSVNNAANLGGIGGGSQAGYIRRTNDVNGNGSWSRQLVLSGNDATDNVWSAPLEIREVGQAGGSQAGIGYGPSILFHWANRVASEWRMDSLGNFHLRAQDANGYRNITAGEVYAKGWFRPSGDQGLYWDSRGRGINVADSGSSYGNITTWGSGAGGWQGYSIANWMTMMANGSGANTARGFYSGDTGTWLVQWDSANNAVFPSNITAFSDERIKRNMRPIDNVAERRAGMAKAAMLYEREGVSRVGFGAQTLEPYVPEVVITADDLVGTKSVNYSDTVAILAVDADNNANRIDALENELAALKALIMEMKGK